MGKCDNRKQRNREYISRIRRGGKCKRCGTKDELTFHHRIPQEKLFTISNAPRDKVSMEKLIAEIAKCDFLCVDCHKIEHEEILVLPTNWVSANFSSLTDTTNFISVCITHIPSGNTAVGKHRTSRMRAHDKAVKSMSILIKNMGALLYEG